MSRENSYIKTIPSRCHRGDGRACHIHGQLPFAMPFFHDYEPMTLVSRATMSMESIKDIVKATKREPLGYLSFSMALSSSVPAFLNASSSFSSCSCRHDFGVSLAESSLADVAMFASCICRQLGRMDCRIGRCKSTGLILAKSEYPILWH
jgi:hypothetical protein